MALKTFEPEPGPSPGTRKGRDIKVLEAEFGDGYSQPTPDGFNHMRRTLSLSWNGLSEDQYNRIVGFFEEHEGTEPFYYTPAGETRPVKWICHTWEDTVEGIFKVSAEFKQSFTLVD